MPSSQSVLYFSRLLTANTFNYQVISFHNQNHLVSMVSRSTLLLPVNYDVCDNRPKIYSKTTFCHCGCSRTLLLIHGQAGIHTGVPLQYIIGAPSSSYIHIYTPILFLQLLIIQSFIATRPQLPSLVTSPCHVSQRESYIDSCGHISS